MKNLFTEMSGKKTLFTNRSALTSHYLPGELPGREKEIRTLARHLYKAFDCCARNAFIYGVSGAGKTVVVKHVFSHLGNYKHGDGRNADLCFINCKQTHTITKILGTLINSLTIPSDSQSFKQRKTWAGYSSAELLDKFIDLYNLKERVFIVVFDEVDQLPPGSQDILYHLTRLKEQEKVNAPISTLGISNDVHFFENLDPRIQSSFGHDAFVFKSYNAVELEMILSRRVKLGVKDGVVGIDVIRLCAARGAQEHGDARKSLDLLRICIEIAEDREEKTVSVQMVPEADKKMENQVVRSIIESFSIHEKLLLFAILEETRKRKYVTTGEIYTQYGSLCDNLHYNTLTRRRVADFISRMDMLGIIDARVFSKGRYGRTREICLSVQRGEVEKTLSNDEDVRNASRGRLDYRLEDFTGTEVKN